MSQTEPNIPRSRRVGAFWESWSPWLLGVAAGVALWWADPSTDRIAHAVSRFLDGSIAAAAVLAGFQVTALSLLLSVADRPIMTRLRRNGQEAKLIAFHWQAIVAMFLWLVGSLVLLLVQGGTLGTDGEATDLGQFTRWTSILLLVAMVAAICASFRVMRLLVKVLGKGA